MSGIDKGLKKKILVKTRDYPNIGFTYFRRLCIFKGITPREPKKKFKGTHHTYYHVKDIAFLHHEPLVEIHRTIRTHEKKIKKAEAKKNLERANKLREQTPKIRLDRIIKERYVCSGYRFFLGVIAINEFLNWLIITCRYPRFVDALGELDDCLATVHLFAALPALESKKIDVESVHKCRRYILGIWKFSIMLENGFGPCGTVFILRMWTWGKELTLKCFCCYFLYVLFIHLALMSARLAHEWQAFISRTHKLRKTFVSVKGIYYQVLRGTFVNCSGH